MTKNRKAALERFAAVQAFWGYLGELVKTQNRDGFPGELRAEANAAAYEAWEQNSSDRTVVQLNGFPVGAVRVNTKRAWRVDDADAYRLWCQDNRHMEGALHVAFEAMTPEEVERVADFIWENFDEVRREELVQEPWEPVEPASLNLAWNEEEGFAVDPETGEQVPGVSMATVVCGTTIEGFRMDGARSGAAAKYVPVRTALSGMFPARQVALLMGGEDK